ncbi:MAG: hypothetical protein JW738_08530, partial [Actinobacteria bacterium]|nr:hypothetical protein [Actinomycetota bacterium]
LTYGLLRNWRILSIPFLGKDYRFGPRYTLKLFPKTGRTAPFEETRDFRAGRRDMDTVVNEQPIE